VSQSVNNVINIMGILFGILYVGALRSHLMKTSLVARLGTSC